jgi:hypothetical protein
MLFRHTAQRPQRILQALRERYEAFAAEHHMSMLEAGGPRVIAFREGLEARSGGRRRWLWTRSPPRFASMAASISVSLRPQG